MSRAAEIAYKNIRLRLGRSALVASAIVLALAFFVSIQVNQLVLDGMRGWIAAFAESPTGRDLLERRDQLRGERDAAVDALRLALSANPDGPAGDIERRFGATPDVLREQVGRLPVGNAALARAAADDGAATAFDRWLAASRDLAAVRDQLGRPEQLRITLSEGGVATTPEKIAGDRVRTRWLSGLALLVAFAGILNAMLMSVTERFREIGTMKCLGALDGFIIKLFLLESAIQGLVGTLLGVTLGVGLSLALAWGTYGGDAFVNLPWGAVAIVSGIALVVGTLLTIGGALLPAYQAARMPPIEAMRTDV